jgi:catechol 2,3-dioxygenase-like lactoylglutathione lyase family enzyme
VAILGYNHVAIAVTDLDRARDFYGGVLGLPELPRPAASIAGAWFGVGGAQLHLAVLDDVVPPAIGIPHLALSVASEEFGAVIKTLQAARATEVTTPRCRTEGGVSVWSALFRDPDGNVLEITDAAV